MYAFSVLLNQIFEAIDNQIKQKIIKKVQAAKLFTIIINKMTNVSNKKQLGLEIH